MNLAKVKLMRILALGGLAALFLGWALAPTRAQQGSSVGGKVYAPPGTWVSYSPAALGANAITLPASGQTVVSSTIDFRGVKEASLFAQCTQVYHIEVQTFAEDGTTKLNDIGLVNNVASTLWDEVHFGVQSGTSSTSGSLDNYAPQPPLRALAFYFVNTTTNPGTCTARLFLQY